MISVFSIALIVLMLVSAAVTRFLFSRRMSLLVRIVWTTVVVCPLPGFALWLAVNSLGSGWGFGLIAMVLTLGIGFGTLGGLIWHAVSARAIK